MNGPSLSAPPVCCVVGGGPAGMVTGYLLARAGVRTVVIEKHGDFLRDFRGDTVHPSTLRLMDELGLLDDLLRRPYQKLNELGGNFGTSRIQLADFSALGPRVGFIAFMPQWEFLNFLAEKGRAFPLLSVRMKTEAVALLEENNRIIGVRVKTEQGSEEIRADLVIGADGRHSLIRGQAGFKRQDIGAPIDVLWFRVGRDPGSFDQDFTHLQAGRVLITIDRGDYWQCAYVIPKNGIEAIKARGLEAFRCEVAGIVPTLEKHLDEVKSWDDIKLLTVSVDRLLTWSKPGLLCIGDAAHAMSPVGGVGINLAVQDAVAATNLLVGPLLRGQVTPKELDAVRRRRLFPTRVTQAGQVAVHERILSPLLQGRNEALRVPFPIRLLSRCRWLRGLAARVVGFGVRPEHIQTRAI